MYAGGDFINAGGVSANYIAKWNTPLSVEEALLNGGMHVYPNPASDKIYIERTNNDVMEIKLFDIVGKQVPNEIQSKDQITEVDLSVLSDGVYFVKINTGQGTLTKKIIIQH